ncbi:type II toxin-antitoxin system CcdA family antitoxin [Candidatus Bathyarchaeota archaeon]|nr:type II toxin-antitoxin system CcdA family antitoxin [Candidatus Bathyarchaeota archaeon]RJS80916.1 MAG: hypothetical protein CW709_06040 [Candidatus Bathyarchaeota archaeon]RLG97409.1 MAG: hypothetical protein DRO28_04350 [Candidatus Bathyarchaeota archaeon]RLI22831.1 MAG: hypothetical protein DRO47_02225 [Candidatus Bathyarchaeota archaeon]HDN62684.1 hypothetical protein [Candidatus Bathyarchaeota archaeon]
MGKVEVTIKLDEKLVQRLKEVGFNISEYAEWSMKLQLERMQGKPLEKT